MDRISTFEIIFCAFLAEYYFMKVLIPLKGVLCPVGILKRVQLVWAGSFMQMSWHIYPTTFIRIMLWFKQRN
jgi:hypothetical protein